MIDGDGPDNITTGLGPLPPHKYNMSMSAVLVNVYRRGNVCVNKGGNVYTSADHCAPL